MDGPVRAWADACGRLGLKLCRMPHSVTIRSTCLVSIPLYPREICLSSAIGPPRVQPTWGGLFHFSTFGKEATVSHRQDRETAKAFLSPERFAREQTRKMISPRGQLVIAACRNGSELSSHVVSRYEQLLAEQDSGNHLVHLVDIDSRFSDTETVVRLAQHVGGSDVYLFQALLDPRSGAPIDQNYMAFLIAARAFREHGANHVTGVLPYVAYARQDKPTKFTREPTTAKLMADLSVEAGIDRLIGWHPHSDQIRGFYGGIPVHMLEGLTLFEDEFERFAGREDVVAVAPDAGAGKLVTHFARDLKLTSAIASKFRPAPEKAEISEIIGDFAGKTTAVILDDMISSGGTIYALVRKLVEEKGIRTVHLGVSHNLCMEVARERLADMHERCGLEEMVVTNSIPQTDAFGELPFVRIRCLSDVLARTINRVHYNRSVSEVFARS